MIRVHWTDMHYVFVSGFYDHPLSGTCRYQGELCKFEIEVIEDDQTDHYIVTPMTLWEKVKARFSQKMFELCVGTHWSFEGNKRRSFYYVRRPAWLHHLLFRSYYFVMMRILK